MKLVKRNRQFQFTKSLEIFNVGLCMRKFHVTNVLWGFDLRLSYHGSILYTVESLCNVITINFMYHSSGVKSA